MADRPIAKLADFSKRRNYTGYMAAGTAAVLVVDDDSGMRLVCRVNLELAGHRVVEAGNVAGASRVLADEPVAAVLLDLKLVDRGDGDALGRRIKEERPDLPLILMTGTTPSPAAPLDFADGYLLKPFDIAEMVGAIERLAPLA
jgi:DNA-binding NtrC family response regulator